MKNEMNKLAGLRHAGLTMKGKTFLVFAGTLTLSLGMAHGITPEPSSSSGSGAVAEEEISQRTGKQPRGAKTRRLAVHSRQASAISSYCLGKTPCALSDQSGATISSSRRDMTGGV